MSDIGPRRLASLTGILIDVIHYVSWGKPLAVMRLVCNPVPQVS